MTQRTQKRHEERLLKRELDRIGLQYDIASSGERPDFVIAWNDLNIGVEVSEFHLPASKRRSPNQREIEETWLRLNKEINKIRERRPELNGVDVQIRRVGDSLPSAQTHKEFAKALVECVRNNLDILPDEGTVTIEPLGYPTLIRYVERLAMERCGFYSSWTIDLNFGWVGADGNDLLMCMRKKLLQRYEPRSVALWLFVIGQYTISRMMGHLSISKLETYHQLNDALEASQYQMVWLCDWNIVRWVRGQGWEQVVALGQKRLDHTASQSAR